MHESGLTCIPAINFSLGACLGSLERRSWSNTDLVFRKRNSPVALPAMAKHVASIFAQCELLLQSHCRHGERPLRQKEYRDSEAEKPLDDSATRRTSVREGGHEGHDSGLDRCDGIGTSCSGGLNGMLDGGWSSDERKAMVNADIGSKMQLWQLKPTNHVIVRAWARVRHS